MTAPMSSERPVDSPILVCGDARKAEQAIAVVNPATGQEVGQVPRATREELDMVVAAARSAFSRWKATPIVERQGIVAAFGAMIGEHGEELAQLLTAEQGKPLADARNEIMGAAFWLESVSAMDLPVTLIEESAERRIHQRHVPLGVVGAIAPWNFPIMLSLWKVGPALLAGNCVVLKPSPFTPLTTLRIAALAAGIMPAGIFSVITGGDELGPWMTAHPDIDKISFTGSTATGRKVMESAAPTLKRVTLELGGNDAAIVLPDVDLEKVVPELFWAAFRNSGQICIASKRLYVHADIYDRFRDSLVAYAKGVKVGDGAVEGTQIGPVQNAPQYRRVQSLIEDCRRAGLTFALGGTFLPGDNIGYFVPITIIDNPPDDSSVVVEEAFGPVLPLLRFETIDEVVRRANDTSYGLGGSVWSSDFALAQTVADRLECGIVWINEAQFLSPMIPFGGHKQSGIGVENGMDGLLEFTNAQTVISRRL